MEETLLQIVEYEKQLEEEINLATKEAESIVASARQKAKEIVEAEKNKSSLTGKESEENLRKEIEREKNKLLQEKAERHEQIQKVDDTKIDELAEFAFKKITRE